MDKQKVVTVPLKEIDPPSEALRGSIDPQLIIELAESIREKGLLQPVILRPVNGRYEIVTGHRRFLAHQFLELKGIPAVVKELDDVEALIFRAIENLQRENLSPMEEARAYGVMREKCGMTLEEICKNTGRFQGTVVRYLKLLRMPPEFQEAVDKKKLWISVAEELLKIDDPGTRNRYFQMAVENGITLAVAEDWVSEYYKSKAGTRYEGVGDVSDQELEVVQKPVYFTCMWCSGPCEIHEQKTFIICPSCRKEIHELKQARGLSKK